MNDSHIKAIEKSNILNNPFHQSTNHKRLRIPVFPLIAGAYLILITALLSAQAATINVAASAVDIADDARCSLREALENAELGFAVHSDCTAGEIGADTIELTDSTYTLHEIDNTLNGPTSLIPIGSEITINGNAAIVTRDTADNMPSFRFFLIGSGGDLMLNDMTLQRGSDLFDSHSGAAILNEQGTLRLNRAVLFSNIVFGSGGIANNNGIVTITASSILDNVSEAISNVGINAQLTVSDSLIADNDDVIGGSGGISNSGTVTVMASTFVNNSSLTGGGGIRNSGSGTATIINSTFSANTAETGGAVFNEGTMTIINSTFSGNITAAAGASVENDSGNLNLINTIIADTETGSDCIGPLATNTRNLIEDGSCNSALNGDPGLAPLADNGGLTPTFALLFGSSAIDAADDGICNGDLVNGLDQRGLPRPLDGDDNGSALCDIGAFELSPLPSAQLTSAPDITVAGDTLYTLIVTYIDNQAIDVSTLDNDDLIINTPSATLSADFVSVDSGNGTPRSATYSFVPPGGSWDMADNGLYTIGLAADQVSDTLGNFVPAGILGSFIVNINTPPKVLPATFRLSFDSTNGTVVGRVNASDAQNNILATGGYRITSGNFGLIFAIDDPGRISVVNAQTLTGPGTRYNLTVEVEDEGGLTGSNSIVINVVDEIFSDQFESPD